MPFSKAKKKILGGLVALTFFNLQDDAYCDHLIILIIYQPYNNLDNIDRILLIFILVETRTTSEWQILFLLQAHRRRKYERSLFSATEQLYRYTPNRNKVSSTALL